MNIQLSGTEEFIDGKSTGSLGQVLIRYSSSIPALFYLKPPNDERGGGCARKKSFLGKKRLMYGNGWGGNYRCNNVLWISGAKDTKQEDTAMEG